MSWSAREYVRRVSRAISTLWDQWNYWMNSVPGHPTSADTPQNYKYLNEDDIQCDCNCKK